MLSTGVQSAVSCAAGRQWCRADKARGGSPGSRQSSSPPQSGGRAVPRRVPLKPKCTPLTFMTHRSRRKENIKTDLVTCFIHTTFFQVILHQGCYREYPTDKTDVYLLILPLKSSVLSKTVKCVFPSSNTANR